MRVVLKRKKAAQIIIFQLVPVASYQGHTYDNSGEW